MNEVSKCSQWSRWAAAAACVCFGAATIGFPQVGVVAMLPLGLLFLGVAILIA